MCTEFTNCGYTVICLHDISCNDSALSTPTVVTQLSVYMTSVVMTVHWVHQLWLHSYLSPSIVTTVHWVHQQWLHTVTCLSTSITSTVRAPSVLTFIHTVKCTQSSPTVATYYYLSINIHHIHSTAPSVLTLILAVTLLNQSMPLLLKQTWLISVIFLFFFSPKTKPSEEAKRQMIHLKI